MYSLGFHFKTWNHWATLVPGRKWNVTHGQLSALHWSAAEVFDNIGTTKRLWEGRSMVSAEWWYPSHFKWNFAMAQTPFWRSPWCQIEWTPQSPDSNHPDFYICDYLKDKVYENNPQTIPKLKRTITGRIKRISVEECVWVIGNFANRIHVCLRHRGAHLEHILEREWLKNFVHKKNFIYNKYFVVSWCIVTFINIFMGGIFFISSCIFTISPKT